MPRSYKIKFLSSKDAAQAYPLIQSASPRVTLAEWLTYVDRLSQPAGSRKRPAGIIALENQRGYIHGLFSYSTSYGLGVGPVLNVDNFIALDTGDRAAAVTRLIDAMDDLARDNGCAAIHTDIPERWATTSPGRMNLLTHLIDAGHDRDSVKLFKPVDSL